MQSDEIQALIASNTELQVQQAISEAMSSDAVQAQLSAAAEGAKSVIALKSSLDSYNAFYLGLITYTSGVSSAAAGANELKTGADTLKAGTSELSAGARRAASGNPDDERQCACACGWDYAASGWLYGTVRRVEAIQ